MHTARHSLRLLQRIWIDGSLPPLNYLTAQYLFASITILSIAELYFETDREGDRKAIESATFLLQELRTLGNVAAQEYCEHLDSLFQRTSAYKAQRAQGPDVVITNTDMMVPGDPLTTGMAMFLPGVQDFLSQSNAELGVPLPFDDLDLSYFDDWPQGTEPQ